MRRQSRFYVRSGQVSRPISIGGSKPIVQVTAEKAAAIEGSPMLAALIYTPPAMKIVNEDPRYPGKSNNVENIYHPAEEIVEQKRSGVMQILNWLVSGNMS